MKTTTLLVGITGHRDMTDESAELASQRVKKFFKTLKEQYPSTPVYLISGMADGADRVAAQAALEEEVSVQAVLPMPVEMYRADFTEKSSEELDQILAHRLVETIELELPVDVDKEVAQKQGPERNKLYAHLGDYLSRHCSILIALWDGVSLGKKGGTSEVILQYLDCNGHDELSFEKSLPVEPKTTEYVYWCPVKRQNNAEIPVEIAGNDCVYLTGELTGSILQYHAEMPKQLHDQLNYLDQYNSQYDQIVAEDKFFTWGGLIENCPGAEDSPDLPLLQSIDAEYQKADGLAIFNQKFSDRQFKLFAYMAALMGLFFLFYAKILASKVFLIGYLGLFLAGFWMFKKTEHKNWFSKHLMQRVIAETLRTRFYMILAGVNDKVNFKKLLTMTGVNQFSGFSWINLVLRLYEHETHKAESIEKQQQDLDLVTGAWLNDQAGYFKNKIHKLEHSHHLVEKIKQRLLIASALSVVLLILFKNILVENSLFGLIDFKTLLVFLMGLLPFWLGVWEIYMNKLAVKELLWQYKNQSEIFSLAAFKMENARNLDERKKVLVELGEKSLMENYLWTIHRYHREHEPPTAG